MPPILFSYPQLSNSNTGFSLNDVAFDVYDKLDGRLMIEYNKIDKYMLDMKKDMRDMKRDMLFTREMVDALDKKVTARYG